MTTLTALKQRIILLCRVGRESPSPGSLAIRGSVWTIVGYGTSQVLRLGGNIVLAWLLFPEAFGLMALVAVFIQGLQMFSDVGIKPSIIQNERGDDPAFLNTAWTIQVIRGIVLWLIACLGAYPFAMLYGEPLLAWMIPVAGLTAVIAGFNSTALATANRHVRLGKVTMLELAGQSAGLAVMISWALMYPVVWALVAGGIVASVVKLLLSHMWVATVRNSFRWDHDASRALIRFGKWIFISTILSFCANSIDRVMLGALVPMDMLGVYAIAFGVAMLPKMLMSRIIGTVAFPLFSSEARANVDEYPSRVRKAHRIILAASAPCVLAIILFSQLFFAVAYDDRYSAAGGIAQLLCVSAWFTVLQTVSTRALMALGYSWVTAAQNAVNTVITIGAAVAGFYIIGVTGFVIGYGVGTAAGWACVKIIAHRHDVRMLAQDMYFTIGLAAFAAIGLSIQATFVDHANAMWLLAVVALSAVTACILWSVISSGAFRPKSARTT